MIDKSNDDEIKLLYIGSCSSDGSQGGAVYLVDGLAPTICACTHGYAIGNILILKKCSNPFKYIQISNKI